MIKAILFDLDGTLLPMNQEEFATGYLKLLAAKLAPYGYEPKQLAATIWAGTAAMVKNDGSRSNSAAFWEKFSEVYGKEKTLKDQPLFDNFYAVNFEEAKAFCGFHADAAKAVRAAVQLGYRVALATNPIFPKTATESRIRWAGLEPEDFEFYTTYENNFYSKPNPEYYLDISKRMGLPTDEFLMVGNDVAEDMVAETTGMKVFLLTNCLINTEHRDISVYPKGDFQEFINFISFGKNL